MASTTRADFGARTEGLEVAKEFAAGIRGKTVLITGVNLGGIGFSTSQAIASQSPANLIVAGRNEARVRASVDALKADFPDVKYRVLKVNLSSQSSVHAAAEEVLGWSDIPQIDIVINNAAVMCLQERTLSEDSIEMHFATNHIGHWLLSCLIMPKVIKAAETKPKGATRIVNVSSGSPFGSTIRWSDVNFNKTNKDLPEPEQPNYKMLDQWGYTDVENKTYVPLDGYNRSKVANVLFGIGATKRLYERYGIVSLAVHPGVIPTELGRNFAPETLEAVEKMTTAAGFTYKTLGAGASTSLVAALDPKLGVGLGTTKDDSENWGAFLNDCQITGAAHPLAVSSKEAEKLWELSETLVKQRFAW